MSIFTPILALVTLYGIIDSVSGQTGDRRTFVGNEYNFEDMATSNDAVGDAAAEWVWRSQAKQLKTLRLDKAGTKTVTLTLCPTPDIAGDTVEAYIANMRYSNDGASDTITASISGQKVGSFQTVPVWACGNHWNVFYETGKVGRSFTMRRGKYQLTIRADTDMYGVEFDKINIKTWNQRPGVDIICGTEVTVEPETVLPL